MRFPYILIVVVFIASLAIYFLSRKNKKNINQKTSSENNRSRDKTQQDDKNVFSGLRNMAFSMNPENLHLILPSDQRIVYGVVMDWNIEGSTATTVSYQTGDASLYLSTGGGVLGGGEHEKVKTAAKEFVAVAQTYMDKVNPADSTPVASKDKVKFYLLTNKGVYAGEEELRNFESNSSVWQSLFEAGNKVIGELRLTAERKE
jgi:hypothetical protein